MKTLLNAPAGLPRRPASMTAFRWSRVLASATLAQGSFVSAHSDRQGQKVLAAMQDSVLNLCRVKLHDQQRLAHGPLREYSQHGEGVSPSATRRPGRATIPVAVSPAASSGARAGRPTPTPTSTSLPRRRSGRPFATSSASRNGRSIPTTRTWPRVCQG